MPKTSKSAKFKAVLICSPVESGWHYIPVEQKIGLRFDKKSGSRRVVCTINGLETFPCALMPYDGEFTIVVSKDKRKRLNIVAGDRITVEIEPDESRYGMPVPPEFAEVLNQDPEGEKLFHSLLPGKQRSILHTVGKIKDVDRRIHAALIYIEHLKNNGGQIIYEQLREDLKRPAF